MRGCRALFVLALVLVIDSFALKTSITSTTRGEAFSHRQLMRPRLYSAAHERTLSPLVTPHLSRDFEMLVFGDGGGLPLILYPTSFGNFRQCKDFHLVDACAPFIESGRVTISCPDANDLDSFYNKAIHPADRMRAHNAYENVILHDVIDFARREGHCHRVAVCGASLGAYHAANLAFRHLDAISHLISLSGAFDISDFFGGYHDENFYFNSPMNTCRICPTRVNTITWASSSAPRVG